MPVPKSFTFHLFNTVIDGKYLQSPNQTVVFFHHTDTTTILAGFTIQNGKGTKVSGLLSGGGIRLYYAGAKIIHNRIINNILNGGPTPFGQNCDVRGAGIVANYPYQSWIVLADNIISNNHCISNASHAYGAGAYIRDDLRFSGNIVDGNSNITVQNAVSEGGGLFVDGTNFIPVTFIASSNKISNNLCRSQSSAKGAGVLTVRALNTIYKNEIIGNNSSGNLSFGGGLMLANTSLSSSIHNNLFKGNRAYRGAGLEIFLESMANVSIENNTFVRNEAKTGGAVYTRNGTLSIVNNIFKCNVAIDNDGGALRFYKSGDASNNVLLVNNTFSGNNAAKRGGAILSFNCNPILLNNIFWNNNAPDGPEISVQSGDVSVAYCDIDASKIQGSVNLLSGLFNTDPMFCDTSCLAIGCNSPCKNTGTGEYSFGTTTVNAPLYDNRGVIRPIGGAFDIGAFEFDSIMVNTTMPDLITLYVYPNPFTTTLNCSYRLENAGDVSFELYDLLGKPVFSKQLHQAAGDYILPLQLKGLTEGVYLLKFKVGDIITVKKVVLNNL